MKNSHVRSSNRVRDCERLVILQMAGFLWSMHVAGFEG